MSNHVNCPCDFCQGFIITIMEATCACVSSVFSALLLCQELVGLRLIKHQNGPPNRSPVPVRLLQVSSCILCTCDADSCKHSSCHWIKSATSTILNGGQRTGGNSWWRPTKSGISPTPTPTPNPQPLFVCETKCWANVPPSVSMNYMTVPLQLCDCSNTVTGKNWHRLACLLV